MVIYKWRQIQLNWKHASLWDFISFFFLFLLRPLSFLQMLVLPLEVLSSICTASIRTRLSWNPLSTILSTKLLFQAEILISNFVIVLSICSINFAPYLMDKNISFPGKHVIFRVNPNLKGSEVSQASHRYHCKLLKMFLCTSHGLLPFPPPQSAQRTPSFQGPILRGPPASHCFGFCKKGSFFLEHYVLFLTVVITTMYYSHSSNNNYVVWCLNSNWIGMWDMIFPHKHSIDRSPGPRPLSYCCYVRHNSRNCQAKSHGEYGDKRYGCQCEWWFLE